MVGACAAAAAVLLGVGVAGPASAHPERTRERSGLPVTYRAGERCAFPLRVEEAEPSDLYSVDLGDGRGVSGGTLVVRLINEATRGSVVRDISGPVIVRGDRIAFYGRSLTSVLPGEDPLGFFPDDGVFFHVRGGFVLEGDVPVFTRVTGEIEDVCRTLATATA